MKITNIKNKNGSKLTDKQMQTLASKLTKRINKHGFVSNVVVKNSSSIVISGHMRSFSIDVNKLGYNARINHITVQTCKAGYKKTNVPTWAQREQYNHIINDVFDELKLSARIISGEYIVRDLDGRINEWEMPYAFHNGYRLQVPRILEIVPIDKAQVALENVDVNAPWLFV